tara:strand:- start:1607 stop:2158 length:552 start_codon:yes stop_codon:yes gene_type:complete
MYINTNYYIYIDMIRNIIVAMSYWNRGIGYDNKLLWHLPPDMNNFKNLTIGKGNNAVLMGKKTMLSLPKGYLPKRDNIVLSNTLNNMNSNNSNCLFFNNSEDAVNYAEEKEYDELWIIGGEQIYKEFLINNKTDNIYLTNVVGATLSDAYFPFIPKNFKETYRSKDLIYKDLSYFYQKFENMD